MVAVARPGPVKPVRGPIPRLPRELPMGVRSAMAMRGYRQSRRVAMLGGCLMVCVLGRAQVIDYRWPAEGGFSTVVAERWRMSWVSRAMAIS